MKVRYARLALAPPLLWVFLAGLVAMTPVCARAAQRAYMPVGGPTSVPYGWVDFCRRVNAYIKPVTDMDHWGVIDQWNYPYDGRGDCEYYALFKRKIPIVEGFPRQALLITVVKDEHNEGHAILTVRTNGGDFVLDNLNDEVKLWKRTGYRFVKRQSQADQNLWVQIGNPTSAPDYVSR